MIGARGDKLLLTSDWLEALALYGNPRYPYSAEQAHHLSQTIRHFYLVRCGLGMPLRLQELDEDLQVRKNGHGKIPGFPAAT